MKTIKRLLLIFMNAFVMSHCMAQNVVDDKKAIAMLKEFYSIYNKVSSTGNPRFLKEKLYGIQKRYCTQKLIKKIRDPYFEQDPLIGDIYSDMGFLKTFSIVKDSSKVNTYFVSYIAHNPYYDKVHQKDPKEKVNIHLQIVNERGEYKIDKIL